MIFQEPLQLLWLLLLIPMGLVMVHGLREKEKVLALLHRGPSEISDVKSQILKWRWLSIPAALLFLVLALARPGWNPMQEPLSRETRDLVFVLDVSKSMLAQDRTPNRLENAKATILSCVANLDPGQRVGLVVFAGTSTIKCPLTTDHRFFAKALDDVAPWSVTHGGTRIGEALLKTCEKLLSKDMRGFQDVILITDGGNQEESYAEAIAAMNELEASLIAIGVGSEQTGSRIPVADDEGASFMLHKGREVWTRMETTTLHGMVQESIRGLLLKAGTRAIDLADIYTQFSAHTEKRAVMVDVVERYEEGFPWMLGIAFVGLLIGGWPRKLTLCISLALLGFSAPDASWAADTRSLFQEATTQYRNGDFEGALFTYEMVANASRDREIQQACFFNMGNCAFKAPTVQLDEEEEEIDMEERLPESYFYEMAIDYYRAVLDINPHHARAAHNLELARRKLKDYNEGHDQGEDQPPSDQGDQGEQEEGEGDPSDSGEDGEPEEGDEFEEDFDSDADMSDQSRSTSNMTDLNNQDIPPPAVSPEQLLQEEMLNNAQREKGKGKKSKPVERDW